MRRPASGSKGAMRRMLKAIVVTSEVELFL